MHTRIPRPITGTSALVVAMLLIASSAAADPIGGEAGEASAPPANATAQTPAPEASPAHPLDGGRFRFGIDATAGLESVSAHGASASGAMYGTNIRLGWQINDLLAIYAQPHLSFGSLSASGAGATVTGGTGTFIGTVMAEATFLDRLFAGAGFGYGILNNPSGLTLEARVGGYPIMGRPENGIRRKGLSLGLDLRSIFLSGATGVMVMGCLGYEAF